MPLHDWTDDRGWDGVRHLWITELAHWLRSHLPNGCRAYLGWPPALTLDAGIYPDAVRDGRQSAAQDCWSVPPPDEHAVALFDTDPQLAIHVYHRGKLVAAMELVSPRNKDRPSARTQYTARYLGHLVQGINLMLIDVLPRPAGFSFADAIARESQFQSEPLPPPGVVSYSVGGPTATTGRFLDIWRRPLSVGAALPSVPLALTADLALPIDLDGTYARAAAAAYLE